MLILETAVMSVCASFHRRHGRLYVGVVSSGMVIPFEYITFLWDSGVLSEFGRNTLYAISRANPLYIENNPNERVLVNLAPGVEKQALALLDQQEPKTA